jgi:hypothetical protein
MRRRVRDTIQNGLADARSWLVVDGIGAPIARYCGPNHRSTSSRTLSCPPSTP